MREISKGWTPSVRVEVAAILILAIAYGVTLVKVAAPMPEKPAGSTAQKPVPGSALWCAMWGPLL